MANSVTIILKQASSIDKNELCFIIPVSHQVYNNNNILFIFVTAVCDDRTELSGFQTDSTLACRVNKQTIVRIKQLTPCVQISTETRGKPEDVTINQCKIDLYSDVKRVAYVFRETHLHRRHDGKPLLRGDWPSDVWSASLCEPQCNNIRTFTLQY